MTEVSKYHSRSIWDGLLWIVTFSATVLVDVDLGLIIGILFSFLVVMLRSALPKVIILARFKNIFSVLVCDYFVFLEMRRVKCGWTEECMISFMIQNI